MVGEAVEPQENRREPHIVLQSGPERRFRATVGCNQIIGRYALDDATLTFDGPASTMMACPTPLGALEGQLRDVLSATRRFRLEEQTLLLLDAEGRALAELGAVYLR